MKCGKDIESLDMGGDAAMKKIITAFLLLLTSFEIGHAEPTKAIQYLMNEPVSMLDWGLYKLGKTLDVHAKLYWKINNEIPEMIIPKYDWDSNRLRIEVSYFFLIKSKEELANIRKQIEHVMYRIKSGFFGIDRETGRPLQGKSTSNLYSYFDHEGYGSKGRPKNLAQDLDQVTEIIVQVFKSEVLNDGTLYTDMKDPLIKCYSPLLVKDVFWSERNLK